MERALALLGYLLGSILPAEWVIRKKLGKLPQDMGENPGGAAAWRLSGPLRGLFVILFDIFKGFLPSLLARLNDVSGLWLSVIVVAPVIGHNWPFRKFRRGGHGLATAMGALLPVAWQELIAGVLAGALPALLNRRHWGVTLAIVALPICVILMLYNTLPAYEIAAVVTVAAVLALRILLDRWNYPQSQLEPPA